MIIECYIDRFHRTGKSDPAKTKPITLIVIFVGNKVRRKVFANKRKLKEKEITESLMKLRLVKLNEAREQHSFGESLFYDGKTMYKDNNRKAF